MDACLICLFCFVRISADLAGAGLSESQTLSRSLSVPTITLSSELMELAPSNTSEGDTSPTADKNHLCVPTRRVHGLDKNAPRENNKHCFGGKQVKEGAPSSPKLLRCRGSLTNDLSPKRPRSKSAEVRGDAMINEPDLGNVAGREFEQENVGGNTLRDPLTRHLGSCGGSPLFRRGRSQSCSSKVPDYATDIIPKTPIFQGTERIPATEDPAKKGNQDTQADSVAAQGGNVGHSTPGAPVSPRLRSKHGRNSVYQ